MLFLFSSKLISKHPDLKKTPSRTMKHLIGKVVFVYICFKKDKYDFANIVYYKTLENRAPLKIILHMKIKSDSHKVDFRG